MQRDESGKETRLLRENVTEEEIAEIISRWTGIPIAKLVQGEREKLLNLKDELKRRVMGQDDAIDVVGDAIIRARAGIKESASTYWFILILRTNGCW